MVRAAPKVTGLSPKEGPPGTRTVIRGEHFGTHANDLLSVFICGVECVFQAEWQSPSKILCRSGNGQGVGDVVVSTKSGESSLLPLLLGKTVCAIYHNRWQCMIVQFLQEAEEHAQFSSAGIWILLVLQKKLLSGLMIPGLWVRISFSLQVQK